MMRRLSTLTLLAVFGSSSLAVADVSLLQSGTRIAAELGRTPTIAPASDPRAALLVPRSTPPRAEASEGQEAPAVARSGMRKRTKILIYVAAGAGFAAAAYS